MLHTCIKSSCGAQYEDKEVDAYYCPDCVVYKKSIAKELDKKFKTTNQPVMSDLAAFEATAKVITTPNGRTVVFGRA
jgi:hypothetical protein